MTRRGANPTGPAGPGPRAGRPAPSAAPARPWQPSRAWLAVPLVALAFLAWVDGVRVARVEYVSALAGWSVPDPPGGGTGWQPRLIVPGRDDVSYERLDQARQMFAERQWRVREVGYENAPFGHPVLSTSPYRWWLGLVAGIGHAVSGRAAGPSLEAAAKVADPLLHVLLLAGAAAFVAWRFGLVAAALLALGVAALFPLAGDFLPGAPDDHGLAQALALWSVLPVLAGVDVLGAGGADALRRARRWFVLAGVVGAAGMWVSVATLVPVLAGIALGGVLSAWVTRGSAPLPPWRDWALAGAAGTLGAFLAECFPAHMASWQLRVVHPVLGLAWLGGGEILARVAARIRGGKSRGGAGAGVAWVLAAAAVAAVPLVLWRTHSLGFLAVDPPALRLARLPDSPLAPDSIAWMRRDGLSAAAVATLLPLVLALPAIWLLARRVGDPGPRASIAAALGPVLVALAFAGRQLSWWNGLDAVLLALIAATTAAVLRAAGRPARWGWPVLVVLALLPGAFRLFPRENAGGKNALNQTEVVTLIERDLARWMRAHAGAGGAVVLAPPDETLTLHYYGDVSGLTTPGWENPDGLGAAVRIVASLNPDEVQELVAQRGITHIVLPRWDPTLDLYARLGLGRLEGSFIDRLHRWQLPPWLRPVPYILPTIGGFEGESAAVFEVVDPQDDPTAAARLTEYFVEMDRPDLAESSAGALRRFPSDLGALVAQARVQNARGDAEGFGRTVALVLARLSAREDRRLPLDLRVSLAVVLALGQRMDLARTQVDECLARLDEAGLRSLSSGSLYHLDLLCRATGQAIADGRLRALALDLLPGYLRARLGP